MTMCLQSMVGVLLSACMTGIVFAKLARPKVKTTLREEYVLFANEKLQQKWEKLTLEFQIQDMARKKHWNCLNFQLMGDTVNIGFRNLG